MAGQQQNMEFGNQGGSIELDVKFRRFHNGPFADDDLFAGTGKLPRVQIINPSGDVVQDSAQAQSPQPLRVALGEYQFVYQIPYDAEISSRWIIRWSLTISGQAVSFDEFFTVQSPPEAINPSAEYRKGFAFNNPDLTSDHHAPGWGLLVTPDELRYIVLFGTKLTSPDASQTYDDNMLQYYIDAAIGLLERDLSLDIIARRIRYNDPIDELNGDEIPRTDIPEGEVNERESGYPYRPQNARHYLYLRLRRRPLRKVLNCFIQDPVNRQFVNLMPWRKEFKGLESRLQFFPNLTAVGNYPYFFTSLIQVRYPFSDYPDAIKVDYDVGWANAKDVPLDIREIVRMLAGVMLLNDFGDGKSPALASASASLNSISESYTTTQSATNALYGARIIQFLKQIETWDKKNAIKYRRTFIGVL